MAADICQLGVPSRQSGVLAYELETFGMQPSSGNTVSTVCTMQYTCAVKGAPGDASSRVRPGCLQAHCINLETMVSEPAEAASRQAAQAAALVPVLGLSEQQQEFIHVGMRLYYDIVHMIHSERLSLQLQLASVVQLDGSETGSGRSAASVSNGAQDSLLGRRMRLAQQQQLTSRLSLLLHKVRTTCTCAGTAPALDGTQQRRLHVQTACRAVQHYRHCVFC
jgi:hypothetical protein